MSFKSWHILIIEDNPDDRADMRQMLLHGSDRRYRFTETELGREGLRLIRACQHEPYDCVLLDYYLPDMNGEEVLTAMRDGGDLPPLPVVVLLGAHREDSPALLRAGAQDYIGKNWLTPESLTRVVENAIERYTLLRQLQQAEALHRKNEQRFRQLLELGPDAMVIVDQQGVIVLVNAVTEMLFGYSRQELLGQHVEILLPAGMRKNHTRLREGYTDDPHTREMGGQLFIFGMRKDGSQFPAEIRLSPLETNEGVMVSSTIRDISQRQRVEAELKNAIAAAQKAALVKADFLSNMSHELRSPLNAILGFAQLLEIGKPLPTPRQQAHIDQILQAGWYLLELINEILDLAAIESGKLSISLEPVSLNEVLSDCLAMLTPQAEKNGIGLHFVQGDDPGLVKVDRTRLKQVFVNLLTNAIKYNRKGGRVDISYRAGKSAECIRVDIQDTGIGLSAEKCGQLFQPFNRLGQETGSAQGTGIGLVVSKRLIELMGGEIGVRSHLGEGSVFWVELTRDASQQEAAEPMLSGGQHAVQTQESKGLHTVLYIDDNPTNLALVQKIVAEQPGMHLMTAMDGNVGIAFARAHLPDVILMDINLPGISGIKAMKILHADLLTANIPIIALSANNRMHSAIQKGLRTDFFRYLTKPIISSDLIEALNDAINLVEKT